MNLKDVEPAGRLEASGRFHTMFSHRVRISKIEEIDRALIAWLKQAYTEC